VKTLLQSTAVLALITVSVGMAVLIYDAHHLLSDVDGAIRNADGVLTKSQGEWQNEKADIHALLAAGKDATVQADQFATEQRKQLAKTSRDSDNQVRNLALVTRNAEKFFYNLDQQVNGKVLPDFDRELVATSTAAQFSLESVTKAGDALTFQLNDPEWGQTLHGLNMTAGSLASLSVKADSSAGHVDHMLAYADKQLTTPIGFWKNFMLHEVLPSAGAAGSFVQGFIK
jgi:hypothetical protein